MAALEKQTPLTALTHIILTHLDAKAIPSLELLLQRRLAAGAGAAGSSPLQVVLSNPALRLLQTTVGACACGGWGGGAWGGAGGRGWGYVAARWRGLEVPRCGQADG